MKFMRDVIETKVDMKLDGSHVIVYRMIRWAVMASTRFMVDVNGKTAYERRRGRRCRTSRVAFGELAWYKKADEQKDVDKVDSR